MIDEEFQGWRITVSHTQQTIGFSNRPSIDMALANDERPPEPKMLTIPGTVVARALRAQQDFEVSEQLRQELLKQWEDNHYEKCGLDWPHPGRCICEPPSVLGL